MRRPTFATFAVLLLLAGCLSAHAGTTANTIAASATLTPGCTITIPALNFGLLSSLTTSTVEQSVASPWSYTCTKGTTFQMSANAGLYGSSSNGDVATRAMSDGAGHTLGYRVYSATNVGVGTSPGVSTYDGTGTGSVVSGTLTAKIITGQSIVPGVYTDTLVFSMAY